MLIMNYFGVLIQHPDIDPVRISARLGLEPTRMGRSGEPVILENGRRTGANHRWSSWSYFIDFEGEILEQEVTSLVRKLIPHRLFFEEMEHDGGRIMFIFRVDQNKHTVCSISPDMLLELSNLKVRLEFEVFKSA